MIDLLTFDQKWNRTRQAGLSRQDSAEGLGRHYSAGRTRQKDSAGRTRQAGLGWQDSAGGTRQAGLGMLLNQQCCKAKFQIINIFFDKYKKTQEFSRCFRLNLI